jgi:hypothetical protein
VRAAIILVALLAVVGIGSPGAERARPSCSLETPAPSEATRIRTATAARRDIWGERLLGEPQGPTLAGAQRFLRPLLFARAAGQSDLTRSGFHYVAFSQPAGVEGATTVSLHVADGSEILAERIDGPRLSLTVGGERYGRCLGRLTPPSLAEGWLPILRTAYVDARGTRYRQESFAARDAVARRLVAYVRLTADARDNTSAAAIRFRGPDGDLGFEVARGTTRTITLAWPLGAATPSVTSPEKYARERRRVGSYWRARLARGTQLVVPERHVQDAYRALLVQNLGLTWRYSLGNAYEQFSFPEGVDAAQVLDAHGHPDVAHAMLRVSLTRLHRPYPNWKVGQKLVGWALHYRLGRDRAALAAVTPVLRGYVDELEEQLAASDRGLLARERFSSDIPDSVYGLHSQAVAWQGLRWIGLAWLKAGQQALGARCLRLADRLEQGLRAAVRESQVRLPDGSLFLPSRLLDRERPYERLTASRPGSYWNLVVPYALASGLFPPGGPEAAGALRYLRLHGARLLGLVRAGAYALYGLEAPFPTSGTDQVYGLNVARFLAANDRPDDLVLSLYGQLAAGMTPGTYVAGEAASVTPIARDPYRAMYLSPNSAANATFIETLRLLLVRESVDANGRPHGLELAHSTPRAWLAPGKQIAVRRAPTGFGPVSYSIRSEARSIRITIDVPRRDAIRELSLRLRLPRGDRIATLRVNGSRHRLRGDTIRLSTKPGRMHIVATVERRS